MYLVENPVLQRELLVNLRTIRSFVLLFLFLALLAGVVYSAWPQVERWDPEGNRAEAQKLFNLFFLGQFILASMMAPSFAAGALTGEKERKTYEMLLASPLKPGAIVIGKLMASLAHLALLIFSSLPIVLLCLPLGGVSLYEVIAAYFLLMVAVATFGMISIACSSYFQRTASSLVVSYLLILPIALIGAIFWQTFQGSGATRLAILLSTVPVASIATCLLLYVITSRRLLYPPDVGSEGGEVVDLDKEAEEAVGLVIQRDQFPDRLLAPPKRTKLLEDNANPVYEKEIHSEIFAQGTLMLRVVTQVSMLLAMPLIAICLFIWPRNAPFYISYVVLFNMLVGPVFSAGSITSERERQTLDLLLTTDITPWQILSGKLLAGLRVSSVLTGFLLWPLLLACVMVTLYWENIPTVLSYLLIITLTCFTSSMLALFMSINFRKTAQSLMTTYMVIIVMFAGPLAFAYFADLAFGHTSPDAPTEVIAANQAILTWADRLTIMSPFAATWNVPMKLHSGEQDLSIIGSWQKFGYYVAFTTLLNLTLFCSMTWLFNRRWRVAE